MNKYFDDAKDVVDIALGSNQMISITSFNSPIPAYGTIVGSSVTHYGSEDSDRANLNVFLQFQDYDINDKGVTTKTVKILNLLILNPEGDNRWTRGMVSKVWNNHYPDSVAIDKDTGEVFLLFIESWGAELRHFAKFKSDDLQSLLLTLDETMPYYIFIDSSAMFNVISGEEGYNHLLRNLYISFKGAKRYRLNLRKDGKDAPNTGAMLEEIEEVPVMLSTSEGNTAGTEAGEK